MTGPRFVGMLSVVSLAVFAGGGIARAQPYSDNGSLPPNNVSVRPGALQQHFEQATATAGSTGATGPAWQITPAIDVSEAFTDNAYYSGNRLGIYNTGGGKPQSDFITTITPSVQINGDTNRLQVHFNYAPSISIYARNSALDQVGQNLNGSAHAIVVPDTLFLDLRAFAGLQSITGGVAPNALSAQNRQNQSQNYTFSAAPYVQHHFGSIGMGEIGYSVSSASNNGVSSFNGQQANPALLTLQEQLLSNSNANSNGNVITQSEHGVFTSGEDFGRINLKAYAAATQYAGNGVYTNAHNDVETLDLAYAINRYVAAVGRVGYEDIMYSGIPPVQIKDVIWAAGTKLTPNPDSNLTVTYGHRYGRRNVYFDGSYAATARLRFFARYSESLTTSLEDIQNTLAQVDIDNAGGIYDHQTGAPIAVVDDLFGVQNGVYRLDRGSLNAVLLYDRDSFSLTLSREIRKLVSASPGTNEFGSSHGTYGTVSWSHELNPALNSSIYLQYGRTSSSGYTAGSLQASGVGGVNLVNTGTQDSFTASATLSYALSPTVSTSALYSFSKSGTYSVGQSTTQNYILLGVHKQF